MPRFTCLKRAFNMKSTIYKMQFSLFNMGLQKRINLDESVAYAKNGGNSCVGVKISKKIEPHWTILTSEPVVVYFRNIRSPTFPNPQGLKLARAHGKFEHLIS